MSIRKSPGGSGPYQRAGVSRHSRGRAGERLQHLAERRGPTTPAQLQSALAQRRTLTAALAPAADDNLWVPIGPTVVLDGQAGGHPRVAGRTNDVWVSGDGQRVYAATANGGVWFSGDRGESWGPLGGWAVTASHPPQTGPSNVLVCGCLLVVFGATADADEALVGTGELVPRTAGLPGSANSGVGILRKAPSAANSSPGEFDQVWTIEGTNLAGLGTFRLAVDPGAPTTFVAATSGGLWTRTLGPAATWSAVPAAPFQDAAGAKLICTDVLWAAAGAGIPARLWVAVRDDVGANSGLFVSLNGTAGPFSAVALTGLQARARITLAVAPSNPGVVYALSEGNRVWRLDGSPPVVTPVSKIPPNLLGTGGQPPYNQAIAVHPTRPERIVLGGATEQADGEWSASLYLANVTGPVGGSYEFGFTTIGPDPTVDAAFIGNGVHPDVHCTRFVAVSGAATELWVGCDGGVFRSQQGDADNRLVRNTFISRNTGIASLECGYVATHPSVDGYLLAGTQDNGTLERIGDSVWRLRFAGDGGGVAFNPAAPQAVLYQYTQGAWWRDGTIAAGAYSPPVLRTTGDPTTATAPEVAENGNANFYSGCDAVLVPAVGAGAAFARFAFGTTRVWVSADWGATWQTLPSLTDPMASGAQNLLTDPTVTTGGAPDIRRGRVVVCRWASATRLFVLCARAVIHFDYVADAAAPGGIRVAQADLTRQTPQKKEDPQALAAVASPGQVLPAVGSWSDLAVHLPSGGANGGPHGTFYVAATGDPATPAMDTLWWFNGTDRWYATQLRNDPNGIAAPAYAVVVDNLDPSVVYVGTAVGVWKGTLTIGGPSWQWQVLSNGLPEASVQDLTLVTAGGVRLLRAAVQARGVWELDLTGPAHAQTFLRVHANDTRRVTPTALIDPRQALPNTALSWHASPDLRARPAQGSKPPNPIGLPWKSNSADPYGLWVLQTAIRSAQGSACKANGLWTPMFDALLRKMTGASVVTRAIWNTYVGSGSAFPNAYAKPWDGDSPTEADLIELIRDLSASAASTASIGVRPVLLNVDVLVHHRHLTPAPAPQVQVTLLRRDVSGTTASAWAGLSGAFAAPVQTLLHNGGAVPALPDGWTFADSGSPVRQPAGDVDARLPRAATFNVDCSALHKPARLLLLAIVHSRVDPVTLPNAPLQGLALGSRFVALRSLEIV